MSTASVSSSKIERDLPQELEAARSVNKYLRTYLGNVKSIKQLLVETDAKLKEVHRRLDNRKKIYVKRSPGF